MLYGKELSVGVQKDPWDLESKLQVYFPLFQFRTYNCEAVVASMHFFS